MPPDNNEVKRHGEEIAAMKATMQANADTLERHEEYLNKIFGKLDKLTLKLTLVVGGIMVGSYMLPYIWPKLKGEPPIPPKIEIVLPPGTTVPPLVPPMRSP